MTNAEQKEKGVLLLNNKKPSYRWHC